MKWDMCDMLMH